MNLTRIFVAALCVSFCASCEDQQINKKRAILSDESAGDGGYLDSIETDIASDEVEILSGRTAIKIPKNSSAANYRVRISRQSDSPQLLEAESVVLGQPHSDVVDVLFYNPDTNRGLSSADLLKGYEFKQSFETTKSTTSLGLMVIMSKGQPDEKRVLLPNSDLSIIETPKLGL
jgi:hypothetical protein